MTTAPIQVNPDRWQTSLKQWTCDNCGDPIWVGNPHYVYYVKPGRNNRQRLVCWRCVAADRGVGARVTPGFFAGRPCIYPGTRCFCGKRKRDGRPQKFPKNYCSHRA